MTPAKRLAGAILCSCAAVLATPVLVRGFALIVNSMGVAVGWPDGSVPMQLQLGDSGPLSDGAAGWNDVFETGLGVWNANIGRVRFTAVRGSSAPIGDLNGFNNAFFADNVYGSAFGSSTVATTSSWFTSGGRMVEGDVIFNRARNWNSYRGNLRAGVLDLRRVAIHEQGHVLGLDHPDEHGQSVAAIMNAFISNIDTVTADDVAGAQSLYGALGIALAPPGAPTSLAASSSGSGVALRWNPPAAGGVPSSYIIEAGSGGGLANLANFATGNTATAYSTSGVASGTYFVRVRASNAAGAGPPSNEVAIVVGNCTSPPGAPSGLTTLSNSGGTVVLGWGASAGAPSTYIVEAGTAPGAADLLASDLGGTTTSLTATAVARGTYFVRIRGRNPCGTSGPSNEIVVVVP